MGVSLRPELQTDILSAMHHQPDYGPITPSLAYLVEMNNLIHTADSLRRAGYTLQQLSLEDLERKKRCSKCNRVWRNRPRRNRGGPRKTKTKTPGTASNAAGQDSSQRQADPDNQQDRCRYHEGQLTKGQWTCCRGHSFAPPCVGREEHTPKQYAQGELARHWRYYSTPAHAAQPVAAVVIDCEMGTNIYGESELIRVSVVDYFRRTVLVDSLVWPDIKMSHYNTRFSGVTRAAMKAAQQNRTCIFGRANARQRVWQFVGPDTVVIGHSANCDLETMRWIHPRVIDTLIIETRNRPPPLPPPPTEEGQEGNEAKEEEEEEEEEEEKKEEEIDRDAPENKAEADGNKNDQPKKRRERKKEGGLSLKALAHSHLNRTIQIKGRGHDSLEDALATRDILHWNVVKILGAGEQARGRFTQ